MTCLPQAGACDYWFGGKLFVNMLFALGVGLVLMAIPIPLPPYYSFRPSCLAWLEAQALMKRAAEQESRLLKMLVDAAEECGDDACAALESLGLTLRMSLDQLAAVAQPAALELVSAARAPEAKALTARLGALKREEAILAAAVAVATDGAADSAPLAKLEGAAKTAIHALVNALAEPTTDASTLHALASEGRDTYDSARCSISQGSAAELMRTDAIMTSMLQLAATRASSAPDASKPSLAKGGRVGERLKGYLIFSTALRNLKRPFRPLWSGPVGQLSSWTETIHAFKYSIGMATASLWLVNPTLVNACEGHGDWVGLNFSYLTGAGMTGGLGGGFKKGYDRVIANSVALVFVMIVMDVGGVTSDGGIIGILIPWVLFTLMMRSSPENEYIWTCMGYTFPLGAFELYPRTGTGTQSFVAVRLTMIAMGIIWWIGWELIFSPLKLGYKSNTAAVWRSHLDHLAGTSKFLADAAQLLAKSRPEHESTREAAFKALASTRTACEAAAASGTSAMKLLPFEPDLFGTNVPAPTPAAIAAIPRLAKINQLLARLEAAAKVCRGDDAELLASMFLKPTAELHAACTSFFLSRRSSQGSAFKFIGAFKRFCRLEVQLRATYSSSAGSLLGVSGDQDAARTDSRIAVSSAVWALIELCKQLVELSAMVAESTPRWALWNEVRVEKRGNKDDTTPRKRQEGACDKNDSPRTESNV